ncbi:hypothetical protein RFI_17377 [Reticulomyxa filosa]|uniref:TRAF-type domain-containing protein n=1 Tax=Reticulomyxa filosa TaxID=46433 RepID=X6N0Q2_RETFI|nr:hypothetical protein RFI_17377 [Reticulomyxa filosa]|eukprot:ETO19850.1 hypothetical protein RFI_17377 [Reticulomyxa filosa]
MLCIIKNFSIQQVTFQKITVEKHNIRVFWSRILGTTFFLERSSRKSIFVDTKELTECNVSTGFLPFFFKKNSLDYLLIALVRSILTSSKQRKREMQEEKTSNEKQTILTPTLPTSKILFVTFTNNPIELNCPQHESTDDVLIIGEKCLKDFLKNNNNLCPVEKHDNCQYSKTKLIQKLTGDLTIMCPGQFEQDIKKLTGEIKCNSKEKLKDVQNHLKNGCPLVLVDCWFKPFGCDHKCNRQI